MPEINHPVTGVTGIEIFNPAGDRVVNVDARDPRGGPATFCVLTGPPGGGQTAVLRTIRAVLAGWRVPADAAACGIDRVVIRLAERDRAGGDVSTRTISATAAEAGDPAACFVLHVSEGGPPPRDRAADAVRRLCDAFDRGLRDPDAVETRLRTAWPDLFARRSPRAPVLRVVGRGETDFPRDGGAFWVGSGGTVPIADCALSIATAFALLAELLLADDEPGIALLDRPDRTLPRAWGPALLKAVAAIKPNWQFVVAGGDVGPLDTGTSLIPGCVASYERHEF